jgi:Stress responsive A/B Barrel Domain
MIRHAVFLRLRPDAKHTDIDTALAALAALQQKIPGILAITKGHDTSPEGLQRGNSVGFTVDFVDAAARDAYLPHPEHQIVGGMIVALCEGGIDGVTVVDWEM